MQFARVVTYEVLELPAAFHELVERVRAGVLPAFQALPGFVSYTLVRAHDRAAVISITVWESRASADAATAIASEWSRNNITDLATIRDEFVGDIIVLQ
jgi:heme-degrading monooxygenase HmoA